jgi:hypothetical protein
MECRLDNSPLDVTLSLSGLDLGLTLGVLLLTGGGEGRWLGRTADSRVCSLDTGTHELLGLTDDRVGLEVSLCVRRRVAWKERPS